jgi:hypothetical protein
MNLCIIAKPVCLLQDSRTVFRSHSEMSAVVYSMQTRATFCYIFVVDGVRESLWTATTNGHIVHPRMIRIWRARVEWLWQNRNLEENTVPVPLCTSQIQLGLTRERTRFSAVKDRRLTAWSMARPFLGLGSTSPSVRHYANRLSIDFSFETGKNERQRTQNPVNCKLPS